MSKVASGNGSSSADVPTSAPVNAWPRNRGSSRRTIAGSGSITVSVRTASG